MIRRRNIVVALDVGTSNIKAALGEISYEHGVTVLGVTHTPSNGIRKGNIIDIDSTARAIDLCLSELERLTGMEIADALVGFSGASVNAIKNHAIIAAGNPNYEISDEDKSRVLKSACNIALPPDKAIVQTIETQYIVDGYDGVKDPVGMAGSRLEAEVVIIIAAAAALQNLQRSIQRVNLHINQIVYNPLLVAEAVLLPAEKEIGVALIDIGGGTTEISVFDGNSLVFTSVLPVGEEFITRDLAIVLRTSLEEAARIKEEYGTVLMEPAGEDEFIEVRNIQGGEVKQVSLQTVTDIIYARVEEIIAMITAEIELSGYAGKLPAGIVLSGGGAQIAGIIQVMENIMKLPVRSGTPDNISCLTADINKPQNAAILGGLMYASHSTVIEEMEKSQNLGNSFNRVSAWFKELFS
jgi:cell division protein FtsA